MCSGGGNTEGMLMEQSRQARISKIKAKQRANLSAVNVVTGGGVTDYRRSISTGAKKLGATKETVALRDMSNLFSAKKGTAVRLQASQKKKAEGEAYMRKLWGGDGGGGGEFGGYGSGGRGDQGAEALG